MSLFLIEFFSAVILATVWALFLPPVKHSVYFNRTNVDGQDTITGNENHGAVLEDSSKKGNIQNMITFLASSLYLILEAVITFVNVRSLTKD
jgi:hypothetical protein